MAYSHSLDKKILAKRFNIYKPIPVDDRVNSEDKRRTSVEPFTPSFPSLSQIVIKKNIVGRVNSSSREQEGDTFFGTPLTGARKNLGDATTRSSQGRKLLKQRVLQQQTNQI